MRNLILLVIVCTFLYVGFFGVENDNFKIKPFLKEWVNSGEAKEDVDGALKKAKKAVEKVADGLEDAAEEAVDVADEVADSVEDAVDEIKK